MPVIAAFCLCALDVCTQKTVYKKFKLLWFKTHGFSKINMIIRTKTYVFLAGTTVMAQLYSGKGGGEQ